MFAGLFILALAALTLAGRKPVHDFEGRCNLCHLGLKDPQILIRDPGALCLSCHPDMAERSHPVDFVPRQEIPQAFPVYRGKLVCITCHYPHRPYGQEQRLAAAGPYLLRAEAPGKDFCYQCHKATFSSMEVDSHALAEGQAHRATLGYAYRGLIPDVSKECLSCHDGTLSINAGAVAARFNWEHGREIGLSHPIDVDYAQAYRRRPDRYYPPASLDPRIVLVEGKIQCITCHDHFSHQRKKLVMDNTGSRLCLACHDL